MEYTGQISPAVAFGFRLRDREEDLEVAFIAGISDRYQMDGTYFLIPGLSCKL
jgi:hypothetical protein